MNNHVEIYRNLSNNCLLANNAFYLEMQGAHLLDDTKTSEEFRFVVLSLSDVFISNGKPPVQDCMVGIVNVIEAVDAIAHRLEMNAELEDNVERFWFSKALLLRLILDYACNHLIVVDNTPGVNELAVSLKLSCAYLFKRLDRQSDYDEFIQAALSLRPTPRQLEIIHRIGQM
jgi:hypothetical protein